MHCSFYLLFSGLKDIRREYKLWKVNTFLDIFYKDSLYCTGVL